MATGGQSLNTQPILRLVFFIVH